MRIQTQKITMEAKSQENQNLESTTISSSIISITSNLQELASSFYLTDQCFFGFHHKNEVEASLQSNQFPGDNFSENNSEQDTLESLVLSSNNCRNFPGKNCIQNTKSMSIYSSEQKQSRQILSNKKRITWSKDLHERFVECVNCLGGAEKATPKAILKLMKSKELNILHVKSHLQKYRYEKLIADQSLQGNPEKRVCINDKPQLYMITCLQIREALQLQLDLEKHLHEQLEMQRNLQMLIEEQGKQVKMMLEKQQKSNQNNLSF